MSAGRLHIIGEGPSEVNFVKQILVPHLSPKLVLSRAVLTSRDNKRGLIFRGGLSNYAKAKNDIELWLREAPETEHRFTTMFDFYRLPNDFPGYAAAQKLSDPYEKAAYLEAALRADIGDDRFLPYLQLHEFEALIFADPQKLDWEYLEHESAIEELLAVSADFANPELVNGSEATAPSKRIKQVIPEFDKVTAGISVLTRIGLETLKIKCPHFAEWIGNLEKI